jgi:outer membrane protein TolC
LKIAQTRQEEARLLYQQSLLNAGKEVNDALTAWQTAKSQFEINTHQVETLREAVRKTELLMRHSGTTYLEILTTQQSLLEAETNRLQTSFDRIQSIIKLYHALGGGI